MCSRKSGRRGERGVTLALMALMLFLTFGTAAMVIDYGMLKASKAEAQRAVDAAALAGAAAFKDILDPTVDKVDSATIWAGDYAKKHEVHRVAITDPEIDVQVDPPEQKVTVTYTSGDIPLWFARVLGIGTMRITAMAAADVYETSKAACVMPVAIPDIWKNNDVAGSGRNAPPEEYVPDGLWNYQDGLAKNNTPGYMDAQEREHWEFDPGIDEYDPAQYGYGSDYRNNLGSSDPLLHKTNDYGRQVTIMTIDSKDGTTSSNYYAWGFTSNDANSAQVVAGKITDESCEIVTVGGDGYNAVAGNGAQVGQISPAWDTRIGYDPGAHWNDGTNQVEGSEAGDEWLTDSPRVVIVALYSPAAPMNPNTNNLVFNNFARMFVDARPPGCSGSQCKAPITGRFLGFVGGPGGGAATTGTLIKSLRLIK
jgi:hypothetical protein